VLQSYTTEKQPLLEKKKTGLGYTRLVGFWLFEMRTTCQMTNQTNLSASTFAIATRS
jgi:hypothetical protein